MKKIWLRKNGGPDALSVEEEKDRPLSLGDHDVCIDVHYSGVNFADIVMRLGLYPDAPKRPYVPGYEVSGIVKAVGKNVRRIREGDEVAAGTLFGGYSSVVTTPEDLVFKKPAHLSLTEAAAMPVNWATAYAAIIDMGRARAGDLVLVDAASGGVGTIALQILRHLKAETIGLTSSPSKLDFIKSYGATPMTHAEYQTNQNLPRFDLILNSQGGKSVREHYQQLKHTGRVVAFGMSSAIKDGKRDLIALIKLGITMPRFSLVSMFNQNKGVYALNVLRLLEDVEYVKGIQAKWNSVEEQKLIPHISQIFKADEIAKAHSFLESRKATGKVLIQWSPTNEC